MRDARGRFVTQPDASRRARRTRPVPPRDGQGRVRMLPSRDARGRFVSFPTTDAPSWYVLCTDGYRIVGEPEANSVQMTERPTPLTLPAARVVRRRRSSLRSDQIVNWVVMLAFLVGMYWYAFSLPVPHR
jgi:hypothetical protein